MMLNRLIPILLVLVPALLSAEVKVRDTGTLYMENIPETPSRVQDRIRPYMQARSASFAGWLPDGGMLVRTRLGETFQVYRIDAPGARREQLTFFEEPVMDASPSPEGDIARALLLRDVGGSEDYQIFDLDLESGDVSLVTDGQSRHGGPVFSRDGRRAAYYSTRRNGTDWDLYKFNLDAGQEKEILRVEGAWAPVEWSRSDDALLVMHVVSSAESYPHHLDLETGELTALSDPERPASFRAMQFGRDAGELILVSDTGQEFLSLFMLDVASGEKKLLAEHDWDVEHMDVSPDGTRVAYVVNEAGYSRLHVLDLESGEPVQTPTVPEGVISGIRFNPDGTRIAMNLTSPLVSGDVYSLDLDEQEISRWTYSEIGGLSADRFRAPRLIEYPTFDEVDGEPRKIPAWYYRPRGEGPFPVIIQIHGGPAAQSRPRFNPIFQYWMDELGLAVVSPNVRGSSGYGKTWMALDDQLLREDSVRDIGALLDWVAAHPELDEEQVIVYGGSYGGYMVLAALMHYGERLVGGVNIVGISNFVTFLENTRSYRRDLRRAEYGDEQDPEMREFLESISPANFPERLNRPLLVIQGKNDPRVPASESEQVITAMREAGLNPWYLLARNEGHGFRRQSNREQVNEAVSLFFQRYLVDGE